MDPNDMLNGANVILVTMIVAITSAIKFLFSDFFESALGKRLLPVVPIVLGIIGGLVGIAQPAETILDKIMVGLMSGLSAAMSYKIGHTTIMGNGVTAQPKE